MSSTEIPGAKIGIMEWLTAKKSHTIVIPESLVVAETACTKPKKVTASKGGKKRGDGSQGPQQHLYCNQSSLDKGDIKQPHSRQHTYMHDVIPGNCACEHHCSGTQGKSLPIDEKDKIGQSSYQEDQQPRQQHVKTEYDHHDYINSEASLMEPHSRRHNHTDWVELVYEQRLNVQQSNQQPGAMPSQQFPIQPDIAASTIPPGGSMMPNPNLGIGSRIQLPTLISDKPFKYGVIRWIGDVPQIQGPVAGIELVSDLHYRVGRLYK